MTGFMLDDDEFDLTESLSDLGFDSLSRTDLLDRINLRFGTDVQLEVLLDCRSLADFGEYMINRYGNRLTAAD